MVTPPDFFEPSEAELSRFKKALAACYAFPFIDGIEDYVVEAILEYAKGIDGVDPMSDTRTKKLYDVVDESNHIGWSVKSIQTTNIQNRNIELVIQRADIFKKAEELGFGSLSLDSPTEDLGAALIKHWGDKVKQDAIAQNVQNRRIFIMLKSPKPSLKVALFEAPLIVHSPNSLIWEWTDESRKGLQGKDNQTGRIVHRWYPGQKQLFESFTLPEEIEYFTIDSTRLRKEEAIDLVLEHLQEQQ